MITRGFLDVPVEPGKDFWWFNKPINDIQSLVRPIQDYLVDESVTLSEAIQTLKAKSIDILLHFKDGFISLFLLLLH